MRRRAAIVVALLVGVHPRPAIGQDVTHRGFVEARVTLFPQQTSNDQRRVVGDLLAREDVLVRPSSWLRFAGGFEARGHSYDQVEPSWRVRVNDRTSRRPALALRRLVATITRGGLAVDIGKQFVIVTPTDRFAPRDYLTVIDNDFLAVRGARVAFATEADTVELMVVPWFTPSRVPLLDQRWTVTPAGTTIADASPPDVWPRSAQTGVRWSHVGRGYEYSAAFFNGFNHLPNVQIAGTSFGAPSGSGTGSPAGGSQGAVAPPPTQVTIVRSYPRMRMDGGDVAMPTRWLTLKGEAAYFQASTSGTDEFVLFVLQAERQTGEWLIIGGYAGSWVTRAGGTGTFAPDRGTTRSFVGRASYTIDSTRSAAIEGVLRETGDGVYVKGELSKASGAHWRTTVAGALIRGAPDDFLGQFRRNSHLSLTIRYSF